MPLCSMRVQDIIVAVAMHGVYGYPGRLTRATARPRGTPTLTQLPPPGGSRDSRATHARRHRRRRDGHPRGDAPERLAAGAEPRTPRPRAPRRHLVVRATIARSR